jgi:putative Mg2+ transporter-C (MgtC) family protein
MDRTPGDVERVVVKALLAYVLALPIGWLRERPERSGGLRTFPLVSVASCGYVVLGIAVAGPHPDAEARVLAGLMTGMGFIGGGAIVKDGGAAQGTSTAAAIWSTWVIGASVAYEMPYLAAAILSINVFTFMVLTPIGRWVDRRWSDRAVSEPPAEA